MDLKNQDDGIIPMRIKQQFQHSKLLFPNSRLSLSNPIPKDLDFSRFEFNQDKAKLFLKENLVRMKREFGS